MKCFSNCLLVPFKYDIISVISNLSSPLEPKPVSLGFTTRFLELPFFSNKFSFLLGVRESRMTVYCVQFIRVCLNAQTKRTEENEAESLQWKAQTLYNLRSTNGLN